jgi:hypothetical protein
MIDLKLDTGDGRNGGHRSFDVLPARRRDEYIAVAFQMRDIRMASL